jgi:hypothetical protein
MATKQPADQDIDFSDIPEVTDFSKAVRGRFDPRRRELEAALRALYEATHAYLNAGSDPSSPTVRPLQDALVAAFAALHER